MWINNELFIIKESEFPKAPVQYSAESRAFWTEQKKRIIEGYWVGGKWMPPNLYFYVNFWPILLNKGKSKTKIIARPYLRDIEWLLFPAWSIARGLSGFEGNENPEDIKKIIENGSADLGRPLYNNEALDLMVMGAREFGKSYMAAGGIIAHEWITNGIKRYLLKGDPDYVEHSTEIVVGAYDSKYSSKLLEKVQFGFQHIYGSMEFAGKYNPCPLMQSYSGSWNSGKTVIASYKKKIGGTWQEKGTKSRIKHVTYRDNPFAAQGSRASVMIKEEIGMFDNLEASRNADVEVMRSGTMKFGSCLYIGTGGDMAGGTIDSYKMFYSPDTFDLLGFDDIWENKGKISMFIPAYLRPNEFKDDNGNTDIEFATNHFTAERERLRNQKNANEALNNHIQYNPLVPSEIFLRTNCNIFPVSELKEWLSELETKQIYQDAEYVCELIFDEDGNVKPSLNKNIASIRDFPLDKNHDSTGAITIYHHPEVGDDGEIPYGRYIAGIDPYDADKSTTSSLGSIIVMDRLSNRVVAEYSGRPRFADMFYENCRRLVIYFNAATLYENEKMGVKQYFEKKNSLSYLMKQPQYIKDVIPNSTVERGYGMHMNMALKDHGEILTRDWLQEEYEPGKLSLRKIRCVPLLKEMILYDSDNGNFDRVMALIQCMYAMQELHKQKIITSEEMSKNRDPFFDRRLNQKGHRSLRQ